MPGPATLLRELHRLRRHLRDLQAELERAPRTLKARQAKLAHEEEAFKAAQEGLKHLKVSIHEKEVSLKSTHQQLQKFERQLDEAVTNKKEYDAKKLEIAKATERAAELENQILEAMADSEERTARMPEKEKALQQSRVEFAEFEKSHQAKLARLEEERRRTQEELKAAEAQIPDKIRPDYQRLVNAYGPDALASVNGQACSHCRTLITAQQQSLLKQEEYVTCKSCGRGLYLPEAPSRVG
jgi:predicted  nucleic acid-binding Zn-ribbon protein